MRPPLHSRFVDKAEAALMAAIEIYNKPAFAYREESFALLSINAWELLLKAKLLKDGNNKLNAIRVYEPHRLRNGQWSTKLYVKRNRANNPMTVALGACIAKLDGDAATRLAPAVKGNLEAMIEVRDNAAHYINASPALARSVLEVGSATIKNFVTLAKRWFQRDLSRSLTLVLPLSFVSGALEAEVVSVSADERKLINYLQQLAQSEAANDDTFSIAIRLDIRLQRSNLDAASRVVVAAPNDPNAVPVVLSEEDIRQRWPWDYAELIRRLGARYADFKQNERFHEIRRPLLANEALYRVRYLDPGNTNSSRKGFFSSNVLQVFDQHYTRR